MSNILKNSILKNRNGPFFQQIRNLRKVSQKSTLPQWILATMAITTLLFAPVIWIQYSNEKKEKNKG